MMLGREVYRQAPPDRLAFHDERVGISTTQMRLDAARERPLYTIRFEHA